MKKLYKIFTSLANLQENPGDQNHIGKRDSQMLHGEYLLAKRSSNGWVYGQSFLDNYLGWVRDTSLTDVFNTPTHAVTSLMTNIYSAPDFKTQPVETLSFMSRVAVDPATATDGFVLMQDSPLWIPENHLIAIRDLSANPASIIDTAIMFADCPYVYGGRSAQGIDCSGLVQLALQRNGIHCPRDADQQESVVGTAVSASTIRAGDIIYFPGHVGIMKDDQTVINATVREMKVVVEDLGDMIQIYGPPTAVRRLQP
ncbi:MAG: C40 family peptidase [Micavibrio aeruginosavorus]|nr:C40 family peptidase [Micavibrio aeruginosavorus]